MKEPIHIISLGAGVQSSTMALMAAAGEITPMPVAAVFADTKAEPKAVYEWLKWLKERLPFPVLQVSSGSLRAKLLHSYWSEKNQKQTSTGLPAFVLNEDGSQGLMSRQCTRDFKVTPGDWYLWSCRAEMPDGTEREGTVQADGQGLTVARETFEEE